MKALVKATPAPGLTLQHLPDPRPGKSEVLVCVKATSLCGTDAHIYHWDEWAQGRIHPPRIIGHELCGEVAELGAGVSSVAMGDYVTAESHQTCGLCFQCRTGQAHVCKNYRILGIDMDGSFAEYVVLPERVLWKTSRDIPPELACVQEPLGNAVYAALVEDLAGRSVLITGCGPAGLFAIAIARTAGAALIIASDISEYRLGLAKQLGVNHIFNANADSETMVAMVRDLTGGDGVDAALEMSGDPMALHQVFQAVKNGGRVSLFGIPTGAASLDLTNDIIFKGIRVYGITGRRLFDDWYRLAGLFQAGLNIRPVITHTFPMADFAHAFELIRAGQCGKIVLYP